MKKNKITTVVFDLDGTLLDTLTDLMNSVNYALSKAGMKERSYEEIRSFVGNGVGKLMERAVAKDTSKEDFEVCFDCFKQHYMEHCMDNTKPYEGVISVMEQLKARGYVMAIVSNKLQDAVTELREKYFNNYVDVAVGESDTIRRKPCPDEVDKALSMLGRSKEESLYVGDSEVDLATAANSSLPCISVLWGFRDEDFLRENGAKHFVKHPQELIETIEKM